MPSSTLHLLVAPPQATPPDPLVVIANALTLNGGVITTSLLDPAVPAAGLTQVVRDFKTQGAIAAATWVFSLGRFLTRPLPAQTIGAGSWKLSVVLRNNIAATLTALGLGFCVAQWRPGTGVIARALDNTATGINVPIQIADTPAAAIVTGSALTLSAGDCLIVELVARVQNSASGTVEIGLLLNGLQQYYFTGAISGSFPLSGITDADAVLVAPAAIAFT